MDAIRLEQVDASRSECLDGIVGIRRVEQNGRPDKFLSARPGGRVASPPSGSPPCRSPIDGRNSDRVVLTVPILLVGNGHVFVDYRNEILPWERAIPLSVQPFSPL